MVSQKAQKKQNTVAWKNFRLISQHKHRFMSYLLRIVEQPQNIWYFSVVYSILNGHSGISKLPLRRHLRETMQNVPFD